MNPPARRRAAACAILLGAALAASWHATFPPAPAEAQRPMPTHRLFSIEVRPPGAAFNGTGVAVGPRGDMYWLDALGHRVVQFDAGRRFVRAWGAPGTREGELDLRPLWYPYRLDDGHIPIGIAVAPRDGTVVVADLANHRIQRFTARGRFLGAWGRRGSGPGELQGPSGVAVAADGSIYVADTFNHRVQRFDAAGRWEATWPIAEACGASEALPLGIAVAADGTVVVADGRPGHPCIVAFDGAGTRLREWTVRSHADPEAAAISVRGLAAAPDGTLVALEWHATEMIARYRTDGSLVERRESLPSTRVAASGSHGGRSAIAVGPDGSIVTGGLVYRPDGTAVGGADPSRPFTARGQFAQAEGVAGAPDGTVYVADPANGRVEVFEAGGRYRTRIDRAGPGADGAGDTPLGFPIDVAVAADGIVAVVDSGRDRVEIYGPDGRWRHGWGGRGDGPGELRDPEGIAVAADGIVYVADSGNHRVQRFARTGVFLGEWGRFGAGPGDLHTPRGIAVGPDGTVRVIDSGNRRVQVFTPDGRVRYSLGEAGAGDGQLLDPVDVAVDAGGATYVTDFGNRRLHRFDACGRVLPSWGGAMGNVATAGRMIAPKGVAIGADGTVYVADSALRRVQRFTPGGDVIGVIGWQGAAAPEAHADGGWYAEGATDWIGWIVPAGDGTLAVVADDVQRFGADGAYLGRWSLKVRSTGALTQIFHAGIAPDGTFYVVGRREPGYWRTDDPTWLHRYTADGAYLGGGLMQGMRGEAFGFAIAPDGTLLVGSSDTQGRRVFRFRPDGTMLAGWPQTWPAPPASGGANLGPYGLAAGPDGTVFAPYCCDWEVRRYTVDGALLGTLGGPGTEPGRFGGTCEDCSIRPVAAAPDGTFYVGDMGNQRIQRFDADGAWLGELRSGLPADVLPRPYLYHYPRRLAAGPEGRVYVLDPFGLARIDVLAEAPPATWHAAFFDNRWLAERPLHVATPAAIAFDWGDGAPAPHVPVDGFSARFDRSIVLPPGVHDLVIEAQGGVRAWVDDRLLADDWDGPSVDQVVAFTSPGGAHHVTVAYNDPGGAAALRVVVR